MDILVVGVLVAITIIEDTLRDTFAVEDNHLLTGITIVGTAKSVFMVLLTFPSINPLFTIHDLYL